MLTESAVVIGYESGMAKVKCQSKSACGQCAAKSQCGTAALNGLNGQHHEHIFTVETLTPVHIGQIIEIGIEERSLLRSILFVYLIPLFMLILSTLLSSLWFSQELFQALFILICTALTFLIVHLTAKKWQKKSAYQPIFLRVL